VRAHGDGTVEVAGIDPLVIAELVDHPDVTSVAGEATDLLDAALDALGTGSRQHPLPL
jgi:hypothetical protein